MGMSRKRSQLQSYLAGVLDGEGSFGIYDAKGTFQGRVTLAMQDPEAVLLLKLLYPQGSLSKTQKDNSFRVVYSHLNGWELLEDMIPFLVVKHRQAKLLKSFLTHRRRDHQPGQHHGECLRCKEYAEKMKSLRLEAKGVKTVNLLLDHELREYRAKREEVEHDVRVMRGLLEGVETKLMPTTGYKAVSAPEQDIVQIS